MSDTFSSRGCSMNQWTTWWNARPENVRAVESGLYLVYTRLGREARLLKIGFSTKLKERFGSYCHADNSTRILVVVFMGEEAKTVKMAEDALKGTLRCAGLLLPGQNERLEATLDNERRVFCALLLVRDFFLARRAFKHRTVTGEDVLNGLHPPLRDEASGAPPPQALTQTSCWTQLERPSRSGRDGDYNFLASAPPPPLPAPTPKSRARIRADPGAHAAAAEGAAQVAAPGDRERRRNERRKEKPLSPFPVRVERRTDERGDNYVLAWRNNILLPDAGPPRSTRWFVIRRTSDAIQKEEARQGALTKLCELYRLTTIAFQDQSTVVSGAMAYHGRERHFRVWSLPPEGLTLPSDAKKHALPVWDARGDTMQSAEDFCGRSEIANAPIERLLGMEGHLYRCLGHRIRPPVSSSQILAAPATCSQESMDVEEGPAETALDAPDAPDAPAFPPRPPSLVSAIEARRRAETQERRQGSMAQQGICPSAPRDRRRGPLAKHANLLAERRGRRRAQRGDRSRSKRRRNATRVARLS